ncbi:flavodoxin [Thomasclavelia sp.]|uniref:flavodoxin n=1 Tax=Thomasclavelia sp. TaxID=3025757 RepID=UPI0025F53E7A|nr:flavodoxin [Thomasclavelia sp.]
MKRITKIIVLCLSLIILAGCSSNQDTAKDTNESSPSANENTQVNDGNILITYFSWSGNTGNVANAIHNEIGGEIKKIEPLEPYTDDYDELLDIAKDEQDSDARPALKENIDVSSYDIIFVGYPNWWSDMPMIMYTFLEVNDFSGKTIVPFNTSGGSGFSGTISEIEKITGANVLEGLTLSSSAADNPQEEVSNWLAEINLK